MSEAVELLRELATKLGTTVEALWPHAVRYVAIDAMGHICGMLFLILILGAITYKLRNLSYIKDDFPTSKFVFSVLLCLATFIGFMEIPNKIGKVFEPTGYLVNRIIR